jgi:hypothetical protein
MSVFHPFSSIINPFVMHLVSKIRPLCFLILCWWGCTGGKRDVEIWSLNSTDGLKPDSVTVWGNPRNNSLADGRRCLSFDGKQDGLLIHHNPIAGAKHFTIQVIFKPYPSYPDNIAQRFLHIQDPENNDHRILMELRLNDHNQWSADLFMSAGADSLLLRDPSRGHPLNRWDTMMLSYQQGIMKAYVNGVRESSGKVKFAPLGKSAVISIGVRQNRISWFHGAIAKVIFYRGDVSHLRLRSPINQ